MFTFFPFTRTWPCSTSCRACAREQAVGALYLLLFAQLEAVAHHFGAPRLPVLPRNEVALFDGALLRKAAQALQKQLLPFPAAQAADGITMSCQRCFSFTSS